MSGYYEFLKSPYWLKPKRFTSTLKCLSKTFRKYIRFSIKISGYYDFLKSPYWLKPKRFTSA